ncbi:UNVERIFIED_CONTAM: hypothetical protein GTU68_015098 [Idotea baltica]|nr:hypothetical protein [Idotea baltica]
MSIPRGEQIALVGASGAGKTTLLRLCGLGLLPSDGAVYFNDSLTSSIRISELRSLRSEIGFIHQHFNLVPNIRVYQNVLLGRIGTIGAFKAAKEFLFPSKAILEEIYAVLARLGITEKMYDRTDRLSGGQMQRVAIARSLFQSPRILLADEPVSSVDPARARATVELLVSLAKEDKMTLLVSMHNFELAAEFFPRLVGMHQGTVIFDSPAEEINEEMRESLYSLESHELLS